TCPRVARAGLDELNEPGSITTGPAHQRPGSKVPNRPDLRPDQPSRDPGQHPRAANQCRKPMPQTRTIAGADRRGVRHHRTRRGPYPPPGEGPPRCLWTWHMLLYATEPGRKAGTRRGRCLGGWWVDSPEDLG